MLGNPFSPGFRWKYTNFDTPGTAMGTAVTLGYSNAEGSWTSIATSGNIAQDVYLFAFMVSGNNSSGQNLNTCIDVGVDPAGGTSYTEVIQNIICGKCPAQSGLNGAWFIFPLFIKAGSSVAIRGSTSYTSGSPRIIANFYGRPHRPELVRVGQYSEGVGTITNNAGVSFTPVNGSEGSWASLGTTTRDCWWWQLGVDIGAGTITAQYTHCDLAVGNGSLYDIIIENYPIFVSGTAETINRGGIDSFIQGFWEVPAGATLYVRGRCSTTVTSGYNARAIGIGG